MKHVSSILLIAITLIFPIGISPKTFSAEPINTVLIIIKERYGSADIQFLGNDEAILMQQTLEEFGYSVQIASASGRTFLTKKVTLESDYKLAEVIVEDYIGFIITCSGQVHQRSIDRSQILALGEAIIKPEEVVIVKKIIDSGKPIAAQHAGVISLAEAEGLKGKKYSYMRDLQLDGANHGGQGVIRDGDIITSTYCPYYGPKDQTVELAKALIDAMQE